MSKKKTMKKINIFYLLASSFLLSACGLTNMMNKYDKTRFNVKPNVLETHGGKVSLNLTGHFPEKYFGKRVTVDFTPVLVYENGEKAFKTISIQGEEEKGGQATIFYAKGGKFSYTDAVKYNKNMINSTLELRALGKENSLIKISGNPEIKQEILGPINIANGVIATSTRVLDNEILANINHEYEEETILEEKATIYFLVNQSNIRPTEKSKEEIQRLKEFVNKGNKTHSIEITSYASPEGSITTNDKVSKNRMKTTVRYIKDLLKSLNVDGASNNDLYTEKSSGEDWEGFESIVKSSTIKDKRRINNIVNSIADVELREQQIRDMSEIYDALKNDVLPQLRKAVVTIRSFETKRTNEEIAELSINNPEILNLEELLFSATLTNNEDEKLFIYNKVVEIHNNWKGYNNIACIHLSNEEYAKATALLKKAEELGGEQSDILTNKGIIAARKGQLSTAQKLFDKANTNEKNQAILDIRQGEYKKAARFFKNKSSYNATLAQLLNGNNNARCGEINGTDPLNASCHYLNAIAAIRRGDKENSIESLKMAINIDQSYKKEAKIDLEFLALRNNPAFIEITK